MKMTQRLRTWLALVVTFSLAGMGAAPKEDAWSPYRFLLGEWVGAGGGSPGKGSGTFSFALDLQGKVIVRKNHAEYPATGGRPAFAHDDLMVISQGQGGKPAQATYYDSEGHVIRYTVTPSADGKAITFVSDSAPSAPRFRLTHALSEGGTMTIKFEIAPPGQPDGFKTYLEGSATRKPSEKGGDK
jgi:hypothetical protein